MNQFFKTFFACLLAVAVSGVFSMILTFIMFVGVLSLIGSSEGGRHRVVPNSILQIDLSVPIVDKPNENPMALFDYSGFKFEEQRTLLETVALIERAAADPYIDGIYLKIPSGIPSSISTLYELRTALQKFRAESGKFIVSYADIYSQGGYYVASAGDKVYMNPQGILSWHGMTVTQLFFKGALDKLGIEPDLIRHGKFKGAGEPLILDRMSPENRLQMESMMQSIWGFMVKQIGESRGIGEDSLQMYASTLAIGSGKDAVDLKLLDGLIYRDEMADELARLTGREMHDKGAEMVSISDYKSTARTRNGNLTVGNPSSQNRIAVVYAEGDIVDQGDKYRQIVGNETAATLREIRKDDQIKAVVFRINSGGGSALASEVIWREVYLLGQEGKPVIVSMGNTAASGGYYIAAGAEYILTAPTTLTGSIGVFGLAFNVENGAKEHLGITADVVRTNRSADIGNIFRPMTGAERMFVQNQVDSVYRRFTAIVAQGRGMEAGIVDELGGGRIWTGSQAVENKLADGTGTLRDAINMAVQRAGLTEYDYAVRSYPEAVTSSFASLLEMMSTSVAMRIVGANRFGAAGEMVDEQTRLLEEVMRSQGSVQAAMPYRIQLEY